MNQDEIYNTPISRRAAIRMGVFGAGTLMLSNWSVSRRPCRVVSGSQPEESSGRGRSVIASAG